MTTTDLTQQTPPQIDEVVAKLSEQIARTESSLASYRNLITRGSRTLSGYRPLGDMEIKRYQAEIVNLEDKLHWLLEDLKPLNEEFDRRGGWERAFLVTNGNGHIHRTLHCTTCYARTQYAWLTQLSGKTEAEIIAFADEKACTICYPTAPVAQLTPEQRKMNAANRKAEAKAAREAERQAKADVKLRNAAQRAQKLMAKVNAWYEAHGGYAAVMSTWTLSQVYKATYDLPQTVGDTLYDDWQREHGQSAFRKDPRLIIIEADAKGLL